jgi:hypothetical protein
VIRRRCGEVGARQTRRHPHRLAGLRRPGLAIGVDDVPHARSQHLAAIVIPATCLLSGWFGYRLMTAIRAVRGPRITAGALTAAVATGSAVVVRFMPNGLGGLVLLAAMGAGVAGFMPHVVVADKGHDSVGRR